MSNTLIRKALNSVVEELSVSLSTTKRPIKVNWENVSGDHANGSGVYLEPYLLPAPTQFVGFQQKGRIYAGVYQVAVVFLLELAHSMRANWRTPSRRLTSGRP